MALPKINISFKPYSDDELDNKAQHIITSLTGNVNFAAPAPSLAEVQAVLLAYQEALSQAAKGGIEKTSIKNDKRKEVEKILKKLGTYVQSNGQDSETILISSGFDLAKSSAPVGILPKPSNLKVENGPVPGSLKVSVDRVAGTKSYLFECTAIPHTDASVWNKEVATTRYFVFNNLQRGKEYAFRVAAIGASPTRVYSDTLTMFAQ